MSLLFDRPLSLNTSFVLKKEENKGGRDTALIGKKIWDIVAPVDGTGRVCLSIQPLRKVVASTQTALGAVTCWAVLDDETDDLAVPPEWCKVYGGIFPQAHLNQSPSKPSFLLSVTVTQPILLTEAIVTALSPEAYHLATHRAPLLESWFSEEHPIIRHGSLHMFSSDQLQLNGDCTSDCSKTFAYRFGMVEPVLQGFAQRGITRFIITLNNHPDGDVMIADTAVQDESDDDGIEIDEGFLANAAFSSPIFTLVDNQQMSRDGHLPVSGSDRTNAAGSEIAFRIKPLSEAVDVSRDHCTVYLRTADLGRAGFLNGDWAMASSSNALKYRLVRIIANDDVVDTIGTVAGSPLLLYNICSDSFGLFEVTTLITLRPSPFGSRQPAIPIARTVTIARVASPVAVDRAYQALFLRSLKSFFDSAKRLVKNGDVIAVSLDTDAIHHEANAESDDHSDSDKAEYKITSPARANEVVYFRITNIEHDVMQNDTTTDVYVGSMLGELGCWVDPSVTRMVQTGVQHSWIPDLGIYFELDPMGPQHHYSTLMVRSFSHLLGTGSPFEKLVAISSAATTQRALDYKLDFSVLLKGARGAGKFTTACWVAQRLGMHLLEVNCYDIISEDDVKTEGTLRARFDKAQNCSPCILVLRHIDALVQTTQSTEPGKEPALANALRECIKDMQKSWKLTSFPVVTLGTTSEPERVPMSIHSCFKHEIAFEAPSEGARQEILNCLLSNATLAPDVSLSALALQTAALVASDLVDFVARTKSASIERAIRLTECPAAYLYQSGVALTAADFDLALAKARASYSESIGAPKIPNVSWDDVGGLANVKSDILDTIQLPLESPELFADGLKKRSGILLYGPPGTGKTLLAKAVATSFSLNFFSVKGPELLNMYIGESEANVRKVFQRARDAKPCVIFFDELDSVAPKRGNLGDSGGVMDRIVSQLLAELDGMSSGQGGADVFVIGATNRPDLLDPALLRPGRFDRMLYLGVSQTHQAQAQILEALTRKFRLDPDLDLRQLAERCPFNYTGADFYALCADAMLNAMSRKAEALEQKIARLNALPGPYDFPYPLTPQYFLAEMASADDMDVFVTKEDFDLALESLVPSVSQSEMEHYARIRNRFSMSEDVS